MQPARTSFFEFEVATNRIQIEYHDGVDYAGDRLSRIELFRSMVDVFSGGGHEFNISFDLSDDAFTELREYLKVLLRSDCFRE